MYCPLIHCPFQDKRTLTKFSVLYKSPRPANVLNAEPKATVILVATGQRQPDKAVPKIDVNRATGGLKRVFLKACYNT